MVLMEKRKERDTTLGGWRREWNVGGEGGGVNIPK